MRERLGVDARAVREVGLRDAADAEIFEAARQAGAVVMTKDADFVRLLEQRGPPPSVVLLTCGNTSNARVRELLVSTWKTAQDLIESGERLVEIGDR